MHKFMHNRIACLLFRESTTGFCMFDGGKYIIIRPFKDDCNNKTADALLRYYNAEACVVENGCTPGVLQALDIEQLAVPEEMYKPRGGIASLSTRCLGALSHYLGHTKYEEAREKAVYGYLNNCPVVYEEQRESMKISREALIEIGLVSVASDGLVAGTKELPPTKRRISVAGHHLKKSGRTFEELIDFTITVPGKRLLRNWLCAPLVNLKDIKRRHRLQRAIEKASPGIETHLRHCRWADLSQPNGLSSLKLAIASAFEISRLLGSAVPLQNRKAYEALFHSMRIMAGKGIADGVDAELDRLRSALSSLPGLLDRAAREASRAWDGPLAVVYFPQLGYFVEGRSTAAEPSFVIRNKGYYKTEQTEELNRAVGDVETAVYARETQLINEVRKAVMKTDISHLTDFIATVDALHSLVLFARAYDGRAPDFADGAGIRLGPAAPPRRGIKPLWKISQDNFQAKAVHNFGRDLLLELAQIAVLAQAGFFLPFCSARLPIFDALLLGLSPGDSLSSGTSTFYAGLTGLVEVFVHCTPRSLCLLDNPGHGCAYGDELAILMATTRYLTPLVLVISTIHNLDEEENTKEWKKCIWG